MSLYNMINGVNPATFIFLPMLGKHPDEYPRFRDCFLSDDEHIVVLTRVGGNNRNEGFGEEELYKDPNFIKTWDDDFDSTYGYYEFNIPQEWKEDFDHILAGEEPSKEYLEQMRKVYPKLAKQFTDDFFKKLFNGTDKGGRDTGA